MLIVVATIAFGAVVPGQAAAAKRMLTLYANGAPIPIGGPTSGDPFEIATSGPVAISIPATGVAISCPSEPETAAFGWVQTNGQTADVIGTNGYEAGPVRECSGHEFEGLLLDGTLHLKSNGAVVMGENELLRHKPQLGLDGCDFLGTLKSSEVLPGQLSFTLKGALKDHKRGCPPVANVEVGPLTASFESFAVEGRLAP